MSELSSFSASSLGDDWRSFIFNFNADPSLPPWGEAHHLTDCVVQVTTQDHHFVYNVRFNSMSFQLKKNAKSTLIEEPSILFMPSTKNSAHTLSELISFVNFYLINRLTHNIYTPSEFERSLPYIYHLLNLSLPDQNILKLDTGVSYIFGEAIMRRNNHMNMVIPWNKIPYNKRNNVIDIELDALLSEHFLDDPFYINRIVNTASLRHASSHDRPKATMLVKRKNEANTTTPGRGIEITDRAIDILKNDGIQVMSFADFNSANHYFHTMNASRTLILSYGGPACTNRFFTSMDSNVIVIGNKEYSWEYNYPSAEGEYWHPRHSHLFWPAKRQRFILDHPDVLGVEEAKGLIDQANSLPD